MQLFLLLNPPAECHGGRHNMKKCRRNALAKRDNDMVTFEERSHLSLVPTATLFLLGSALFRVDMKTPWFLVLIFDVIRNVSVEVA